MHAEDETHAERSLDPLDPLDPLDRLRHDLRSPLTTIRGRAYLLARAVRRAPSLTEEERTRMLDGVAAIETAVAAMVIVIDGIDGDRANGASQDPDPS
jgi:signal transduction histidine kinase